VFGIQTGVALMFLVKKEKQEDKCRIEYVAMEDAWRKEAKLDWLRSRKLENIPFQKITPDKNHNWINLADNDFESLLTLASKDVKLGRSKEAIFELFSLGVVTNRDEWVYDFNEKQLQKKVKFFCEFYENEKIRWNKSDNKIPIRDFVDRTIKWTEELEEHLKRGSELKFKKERLLKALYRPFVKQSFYFDKIITHRIYQNDLIFGIKKPLENKVIYFSGPASSKPFSVLSTNSIAGIDFLEKSQSLPLYRYTETGERVENITDWGLERFREHYGGSRHAELVSASRKNTGKKTLKRVQGDNKRIRSGKTESRREITKEDIFHYTYAVLHNPTYRKKYELNLKREFPRLPFYKDFWKWAAWGKALMELHIHYEDAKPFGLKVQQYKNKTEAKRQKEMFAVVREPEPLYAHRPKIKVKLKADKEAGVIEIDELTFLSGVPKEAWEYKLGNRSALEWVLDQYKEKKPKDPTIAEKFNTYRFADYKEHVIELLQKVCTVSVETIKIIEEMEKEHDATQTG